jgi:hypothetical protein
MGGSYSKMLGELADDKRVRGCGRDSTFEIQGICLALLCIQRGKEGWIINQLSIII